MHCNALLVKNAWICFVLTYQFQRQASRRPLQVSLSGYDGFRSSNAGKTLTRGNIGESHTIEPSRCFSFSVPELYCSV